MPPSGNTVLLANDDDYGLHQDYENCLEELAPHAPTSLCRPRGRWHNRTGEDNADAHHKRAAETGCTSQIMGREVVVAVSNGRLDLSTCERIFYGEFDGRRRKQVLVKIVGE